MKLALCGLDCAKCGSFESKECKGCHEMKGTSIYGRCEWYHCCTNKGLEHCGKCVDFPCDGLTAALTAVGGLSAIDNLKNLN